SPTRCATSRGTAGGGGTVIPVNSVSYEVFLLILQFQYSGQASIVQQKHHPHAGCDERSCWHTHCIATVDLGLDTVAAAAPSAARAYHRAPKSSTAAPATLIGAPTISTLVSSAAPKDNVVPVVHEEESFNQTSTSYHSFTKSLQWKLSLANDYYKLLEKWSDDLGYAVKKGRGGRKTTQWTYTECRVASTGGLRLLGTRGISAPAAAPRTSAGTKLVPQAFALVVFFATVSTFCELTLVYSAIEGEPSSCDIFPLVKLLPSLCGFPDHCTIARRSTSTSPSPPLLPLPPPRLLPQVATMVLEASLPHLFCIFFSDGCADRKSISSPPILHLHHVVVVNRRKRNCCTRYHHLTT
ncbi:hypothetical protein BHM03_00053254, partial [Ensete ventricosum]